MIGSFDISIRIMKQVRVRTFSTRADKPGVSGVCMITAQESDTAFQRENNTGQSTLTAVVTELGAFRVMESGLS